jgi:hypothetical protein
LHFNDVYTIEEASEDPVGGAARFASAVKKARKRFEAQGEEALLFFSGDALSPSVMSSVTRGKHMVSVFNELGLTAACIGNHDFDFGTVCTLCTTLSLLNANFFTRNGWRLFRRGVSSPGCLPTLWMETATSPSLEPYRQ